jgi:hypothetical protein
MNKLITTVTLFLTIITAFSQVSENRTVSNFSKLKASQGIQIFYTIADNISLKVETDDNEKLKFIKTEVEGETLNIFVETENATKSKSRSYNGTNINGGVSFTILKVYVTGKALSSIKSSSSAKVKIQNLNKSESLEIVANSSGSVSGSFDCSDFKAEVSSSGDLKGNVNANSIDVKVSSSGDVTLDGKATSLEVKASSSGDCNLKGLTVENAVVKAGSSANVTVTVSKSLDATASSSADVNYFGNPSQVNTEKNSSGSINKR